MRHPTKPMKNLDNWICDENEKLTGFSWRAGVRRDTTGITFWSDVFLHDAENGDKLAIIIVDSQGLFDNQTTVEDNAKVFSISTLMSSQLILNLSGVIQEDQLQYLQFATEFANFSSPTAVAGQKAFQNFMFLIRDWSNPDEFEFGVDGGQKYLNEVLKIKPSQTEDLKSVRHHIKDSFDSLSCCLLPYPGNSVSRDSTYDGRWGSMDEDFARELKASITELLKPEKLVVKKVNNVEMTSASLNDYLRDVFNIFKTSKAPKASTIYESTVESFMTKFVEKSFEIFKAKLQSPDDESQLQIFINLARNEALSHFDTTKKMGSQDHVAKFRGNLERKIEAYTIEYRALSMAHIMKLRDEQKKKLDAEKEAAIIRAQREHEENQRLEKIAQLEAEARTRAAEAARKREEIRLKQLEIQKEIERQRIAEEQRQRELAEQSRLEEERRRLEDEARRQREEDDRRNKILFEVRAPHVNFDVPKPKCEIM